VLTKGAEIPVSDGDRFIWNRNLQSHAKGRLTPGCHGCVDAGIKETFGVKLEDVIAGRNVVEMERPGAVGARLGAALSPEASSDT